MTLAVAMLALPDPVETVVWICQLVLTGLAMLFAPFLGAVCVAGLIVLAISVAMAAVGAVVMPAAWVLDKWDAWRAGRAPPAPPPRMVGETYPSVWGVLQPRGWRGQHLQLASTSNSRAAADASLARAPEGSRLVRMYREAPPELYVVKGYVEPPPDDETVEDMF